MRKKQKNFLILGENVLGSISSQLCQCLEVCSCWQSCQKRIWRSLNIEPRNTQLFEDDNPKWSLAN